jgi:CRISPR/Cas system-associated protein Cas10 (large subunit of type III CRISPR-Cas system)
LRLGRVNKLLTGNLEEEGDRGENAAVALFERSITKNVDKKISKISHFMHAKRSQLVHNKPCRRSKGFLEDSLWLTNSEVKGPLHMILTEELTHVDRRNVR